MEFQLYYIIPFLQILMKELDPNKYKIKFDKREEINEFKLNIMG